MNSEFVGGKRVDGEGANGKSVGGEGVGGERANGRTKIVSAQKLAVRGQATWQLRWIITTRVKRMAAQNAQNSLPRAAHCTVFAHGFNEVVATTWSEPASPAKKWTQCPLIQTYQGDQHRRRQPI